MSSAYQATKPVPGKRSYDVNVESKEEKRVVFSKRGKFDPEAPIRVPANIKYVEPPLIKKGEKLFEGTMPNTRQLLIFAKAAKDLLKNENVEIYMRPDHILISKMPANMTSLLEFRLNASAFEEGKYFCKENFKRTINLGQFAAILSIANKEDKMQMTIITGSREYEDKILFRFYSGKGRRLTESKLQCFDDTGATLFAVPDRTKLATVSMNSQEFKHIVDESGKAAEKQKGEMGVHLLSHIVHFKVQTDSFAQVDQSYMNDELGEEEETEGVEGDEEKKDTTDIVKIDWNWKERMDGKVSLRFHLSHFACAANANALAPQIHITFFREGDNTNQTIELKYLLDDEAGYLRLFPSPKRNFRGDDDQIGDENDDEQQDKVSEE